MLLVIASLAFPGTCCSVGRPLVQCAAAVVLLLLLLCDSTPQNQVAAPRQHMTAGAVGPHDRLLPTLAGVW